ncbi:hypothetical protein [Streptomonospora salina]|uniref:Pectin methylesterase-like acyl-CoA thioesterase n=1 Tax=Streptomonospora salina TaxID=104205 RepID=A0A841ECV9_9ACTN|nr:hypothetical protein [Streptomonospora salina]MBB6000234.1 pectin methylesterase-like acyl-CoA thioesterase [Streptomonospora salina]
MHEQLPRVIRDATALHDPDDRGVLTIYRSSMFSINTRNLRFADFTTLDGRWSQVHRQLRGSGYYVIGSHGIAGETGFHESIEAAVLNALNYHYPPCSDEDAAPERIDADPREGDRRR